MDGNIVGNKGAIEETRWLVVMTMVVSGRGSSLDSNGRSKFDCRVTMELFCTND